MLATVDGVPDNEVAELKRDSMTGNSVIVDCDSLAVILAHFIPGSINVSEGDLVATGQKIALIGNSCSSGKLQPHVHIQTITPPEIQQSISATIPSGLFGRPKEVAQKSLFILQDDYVNGCILEVDGGLRL